MNLLAKYKGPLLIVLFVALIGGLAYGASVYKPTKQTQSTNPTANWETYENKQLGITFQYPEDWFAEKGGEKRIYIQSHQGDFTKDTVPSNFRRIWISYDQEDSSVERESRINNKQTVEPGLPITEVTSSAIENDSAAINLYQYTDADGFKYASAFWGSSTRYSAEAAVGVTPTIYNQQVETLKLVLSTFKFTK